MDKNHLKKICFIAQFPPPIHGLSKAVETLYNSKIKNEFKLEKINITNNKIFLKNFNLIKKSKADLFYFTISQTKGGNIRDLIIFKLLELQHKKCIIHLHGGYYRQLVDNDMSLWQRKANYKAISKLAGAIVLGESLKPIFQGMLTDNKIFIVPNCVDDKYLMNFKEFDKKLSNFSQQPINHILYLSNFIRTKGYLEVLNMAKLEKERCNIENEKKFHFDFAGEFFEEREKNLFFNFIKNNKLERYITYHGVVSGDKKRRLLKKCNIFILLTHYPKEGQPISILEAMGNGLLVVTTDHAGIPDIINNGVNGIIIKKKDNIYKSKNEIAQYTLEKLKKVLNGGKATEMIDCAYKQIQSLYKEENYINNIYNIFRK